MAFLSVIFSRDQCIQFDEIYTESFHACTLYDIANTDMTSTVENLWNMISTYAKPCVVMYQNRCAVQPSINCNHS